MKSELESLFAFTLKANGLPTPTREHMFAKEIGRKWRFDFCYPEKLVAIEIEGGVWVRGRHNTGSGFQADIEKYNAAQLLGWLLLRYTGDMIKRNPKKVVDEVKRALEMR